MEKGSASNFNLAINKIDYIIYNIYIIPGVCLLATSRKITDLIFIKKNLTENSVFVQWFHLFCNFNCNFIFSDFVILFQLWFFRLCNSNNININSRLGLSNSDFILIFQNLVIVIVSLIYYIRTYSFCGLQF